MSKEERLKVTTDDTAFEIGTELRKLADKIMEADAEDLTQLIADFEEAQEVAEKKVANYVYVIRKLKEERAPVAGRVEYLKERYNASRDDLKRVDGQIERLEEALTMLMASGGIEKATVDGEKIHLRDFESIGTDQARIKPEEVEVHGIPAEELVKRKVTYSWDKNAIKDALEGKLADEVQEFAEENFYIKVNKKVLGIT